MCSRSSANAEAFAQRSGATTVYAGVSQLVAESGIGAVYIGAVYIGTPNSLPADHCCARLSPALGQLRLRLSFQLPGLGCMPNMLTQRIRCSVGARVMRAVQFHPARRSAIAVQVRNRCE